MFTAERATRGPLLLLPPALLLALSLVLALTLAGCGPDSPGPPASAPPRTGVPTLTPLVPPPRPPATGRLLADLRQSSRDAALGRVQVWIGNDTVRDVSPTAIVYRDPRLRRPLAGERLRLAPARSERGYPLSLPRRPACSGPATTADGARLTVWFAGHRTSVPVTDDNDVVERYVAARCLALEVARVAVLSFADRVPAPGSGDTGVLTLLVRPTGAAGHTLRIDTVAGTPLFSAAGDSAWAPDARVRGNGAVRRIRLPVQPARCDDHVFMEAAGATAFLVALHLDGRPGQLVVRMSPAGTSAAISFARDACGR